MLRFSFVLVFLVGCGAGVEPGSGQPGSVSRDSDTDGVFNQDDVCPGTPNGADIDEFGCALSQLDSDRDGFSDEEEIFSTPGTDPFDPTDTPINVRDVDGDGCSDFDEINFGGFCDNDPNTPPDSDQDGVPDGVDNCILAFNPSQSDVDQDGIGDACDVSIETIIVADDGQFLGVVSDNSFDTDSIANRFGSFGSPFSQTSIWNMFGTYGSEFSSLSPWNDFTSTPPRILENGVFVAYLTTNTFRRPRVDPNDLAILVGRPEEIRP